MAVTPKDFLEFAQGLSDTGTEIEIRTAISRAYYAGYLSAKCAQQSEGNGLPAGVKGGVHARLIAFYDNTLAEKTGRVEQKRIAALLRLSKRLRVRADYEIDRSVSAEDKSSVLRYAREIHNMLTS